MRYTVGPKEIKNICEFGVIITGKIQRTFSRSYDTPLTFVVNSDVSVFLC